MSTEEENMADSPVQSLRDTIDEKIAALGPALRGKVADTFVDAELDRRAKIVLAGVTALREAEADLQKINRGDSVSYDVDGKIASQTYTKNRLTEIKKARERILKLEFALTKTISDHAVSEDFEKLEKAIKSKGGDSKPEADEE
jgi:hypothetical protein